VKKSVRFIDIRPFAKTSLKAIANSLGVETPKGEMLHSSIKGWGDIVRQSEDIIRYGVNDVVTLEQVVVLLVKHFADETQGIVEGYPGLLVMDYSSLSSFAKFLFFELFHNRPQLPSCGMFKESLLLQHLVRGWYFGGRVECGFIGMKMANPVKTPSSRPKCLDLSATEFEVGGADFSSHYPAVMRNTDFPMGKPSLLEARALFSDAMFNNPMELLMVSRAIPYYFLEIKFRHLEGNTYRPLFPVRADSGLVVFPLCESWQSYLISKEELEFVISNEGLGMEFQLGKILVTFSAVGRPFTEFIEHFYDKKMECDALLRDPKTPKSELPAISAKREAQKGILNTSYGGMAIDPLKCETYLQFNDFDNSRLTALRSMFPVEHVTISEDGRGGKNYFVRYKSIMHTRRRNIFAGMLITAIGRLRLWWLIHIIERAGIRFLYCDTDSVYAEASYSRIMEAVKEAAEAVRDPVTGLTVPWLEDALGDPTGQGRRTIGGLTDELGKNSDPRMIILGAKCYVLGGHVKFKGFSQKAMFGKKDYYELEQEDGRPPLRVLRLSEDREELYFKMNDLPSYNITVEDMEDYACGRIGAIEVNTWCFMLGKTQVGETRLGKGLRSQDVKKMFRISYGKGRLGPAQGSPDMPWRDVLPLII
jgi:hypothetical protein